MILIALQYDGLNRAFIPLDDEVPQFEDGELYLMSVSASGHDVSVEPLDFRPLNIAHA